MKTRMAEAWLIFVLTLYMWIAALLGGFGAVFTFLFPGNPPWHWSVTVLLWVSSGVGCYTVSRRRYRFKDFCAFLESLGFEFSRRSPGGFLGQKGSIYLSGFFYSTYMPSLPEFGSGRWFIGPTNIQFYIPCDTELKLHHRVARGREGWSVEKWGGVLGRFLSPSRADDERALLQFLEGSCGDLPFLQLSEIYTSPQALRVATGPARLTYRGLLQEHFSYVLTFLERLQEKLGCQKRPHLFGAEFDMMPIDRRLKVMQKSFVGPSHHLIFRSR